MSVVETIIVFAVIPLAIVLLFAVLTLLPGREKKARYKPGQPWEHAPVWWEPQPIGGGGGHHDSGPTAIGSSVYQESHGEDAAHGASAAATRPAPVSSGPLGGARGTW